MIRKSLIHFAAIALIPAVAHAQSPRDLEFSGRCDRAQNSAVLSFSGDILIHHDLYKKVAGGDQNFSTIWRATNKLIQKADFSIANLEGPAALGIRGDGKDMGDVGFTYNPIKEANPSLEVYRGTSFLFNFHPRILSDLKNSGYDLLTLANNHSLDRRGIGIDRTIEAAQKINLPTVGTRLSYNKDMQYYQIADIKGVRVAFLGCTEMTNGISDRADQVLYCGKHLSKILNMITTLKNHPGVDAIVILPHWGDEYKANPNSTQRDMGRKFLEAGATAVIGSHPHVLQPWEKYITSDGRETLILYSLGNFVAFQAGLEKKTGVVAYLKLNKNNGNTSIAAVGYTPTYRDGYYLNPVAKMPSDMRSLINTNFGLAGFIGPEQNLNTLCR